MLANRLVQKIMSAIPDVVMNGDPDQRYPGTHVTNKFCNQLEEHIL